MAFAIGDKVRCVSDTEAYGTHPLIGVEYEVVDGIASDGWSVFSGNGVEYIRFSENDFELINKKKNIMSNIVEKIKLALKSEPEKSFIKSGIMDENENLTDDGRKVLEMILVEANKDALKEKADIILAEEKEVK